MKKPIYRSRKVADLSVEDYEKRLNRLANATKFAKEHKIDKASVLFEEEKRFQERYKSKCIDDENVVIHKRGVYCEKLEEMDERESEKELRKRMKDALSKMYFE